MLYTHKIILSKGKKPILTLKFHLGQFGIVYYTNEQLGQCPKLSKQDENQMTEIPLGQILLFY